MSGASETEGRRTKMSLSDQLGRFNSQPPLVPHWTSIRNCGMLSALDIQNHGDSFAVCVSGPLSSYSYSNSSMETARRDDFAGFLDPSNVEPYAGKRQQSLAEISGRMIVGWDRASLPWDLQHQLWSISTMPDGNLEARKAIEPGILLLTRLP